MSRSGRGRAVSAAVIDDDDVGMDWVRDWTERSGILESDLPDWPKDWPLTVRNYARWLDSGHQ